MVASPRFYSMEADWKKFRAMVPRLRERYLSEINRRVAAMLADPQKTETERFWDAKEAMEKQARVLCACLDGHSRSRMFLAMLMMVRAGMLLREDLAEFSQELQDELGRSGEAWEATRGRR